MVTRSSGNQCNIKCIRFYETDISHFIPFYSNLLIIRLRSFCSVTVLQKGSYQETFKGHLYLDKDLLYQEKATLLIGFQSNEIIRILVIYSCCSLLSFVQMLGEKVKHAYFQ